MAAPLRGLNARDSLAAMKPTDALVLDNLVCRPSYVEIRKGWQNHVTGILANVQTLVSYSPLSGSRKLFAAAGGSIYDVTTAGVIGAAAVTGLTNAYWSYAVLGNTGGNFLIMVNGTDTAQSYNGTTWAAWAVTGIATTSLSFVTTWKRRVWAIEKNSFRAWYLATDTITGALTSFDFKTVFTRGGYLVAILNWTVDGGSGVDDLFVAVSSEGEFALYQGSDPVSAATFSLQGTYYIGKPVGTRFFTKFGGDILLLTAGGLVALSKYLQSAVLDETTILSDRIQQKIISDVASYSSTLGWELLTYFEDNLLILQVPGGSVGSRYQYVMNTLTGAWSKTLIAPVITFATHDGRLYAGHSDRVANSWTGGLDNTTPITFRLVPAFSYFGTPTQGKLFLLGRLTIEASGSPTYLTRLFRDFDTNYLFPSQVPAPASGALWGVALWGVAIWGGLTSFYRRWFSLSGYAYSATCATEGVSNLTTLRFVAADYTYKQGSVL